MCWLLLLISLTAFAATEDTITVRLRGQDQVLAHLAGRETNGLAAVIFLPGDGGWRGSAILMARAIASWGYPVYGFDTKRYLENASASGVALQQSQLTGDMRALSGQIGQQTHRRVILAGWSQGAGMAMAAVSGTGEDTVLGVLALGLPQTAVLGWDWKATLAAAARREPDQPKFLIRPLLAEVRKPVWMIHGSQDEWTSIPGVRGLFQTLAGPKRLEEIEGANHRFDGHQDQLFRSMRNGLEWLSR